MPFQPKHCGFNLAAGPSRAASHRRGTAVAPRTGCAPVLVDLLSMGPLGVI